VLFRKWVLKNFIHTLTLQNIANFALNGESNRQVSLRPSVYGPCSLI